MRSSNIGGQAVMEGVMMKNKDVYAVAVRKPDKEIDVQVFPVDKSGERFKKIPVLRGVEVFITSLVIGMKTLTYSASFFEDEEGKEPLSEKKEKALMTGTILLSVLLAVGLFMVTPYLISLAFGKLISSVTALAVIEGVMRLVIFFVYIAVISRLEDIQRVFMYHGAEHKCINCIEHGYELTVENVRKASRLHKRCGTSFLLIVMIVSVIFFVFIRIQSPLWRLVIRLLLIPVIAGVSYEFLKFAGRSDNAVINTLSKPGLWLQKMTTKEPDDSMIEVGIASVEAVFDWKAFLQEEQP
ncbi:MAG: DUF1385 domain-containing protein [Lachnospiraceae bacterium]